MRKFVCVLEWNLSHKRRADAISNTHTNSHMPRAVAFLFALCTRNAVAFSVVILFQFCACRDVKPTAAAAAEGTNGFLLIITSFLDDKRAATTRVMLISFACCCPVAATRRHPPPSAICIRHNLIMSFASVFLSVVVSLGVFVCAFSVLLCLSRSSPGVLARAHAHM